MDIAAGRTIYWNVTAARQALVKLQSAIQETESMRGISPPFGMRVECEKKEEKPERTQDILTKREVAEFLRVSPRTVDLWREVHGMPCDKIGAVIRFSRTEVEKWFRDFKVKESKES